MCVCVSLCVSVCLCVGMHHKVKTVVKEIIVRSSRIFQFTSFPLGCAVLQAILLVHVSVSLGGAKLLTVSTNFLIFHNFISKVARITKTISKGKNLMIFRKLSGHSEHLLFIHDMQSVRSVRDCTAVLYEPASWCYIYIKSIIS